MFKQRIRQKIKEISHLRKFPCNIIILCFSTLIAVFIRLLVFYQTSQISAVGYTTHIHITKHKAHSMMAASISYFRLLSLSLSLAFPLKENKAKMRYQRRVITSSRYLANIDSASFAWNILFHSLSSDHKSGLKFIVRKLFGYIWFIHYSCNTEDFSKPEFP